MLHSSESAHPVAPLPLVTIDPTSPLCSALRVFLFVDPELVSASVCSALLLEIEAAQEQQTPEACMRHVVSHALQAALGEACHAGALHRKLQVMALPAVPCQFQPWSLDARTSSSPCSSSFSCFTSPFPPNQKFIHFGWAR